jgi:hypothetical protein
VSRNHRITIECNQSGAITAARLEGHSSGGGILIDQTITAVAPIGFKQFLEAIAAVKIQEQEQ